MFAIGLVLSAGGVVGDPWHTGVLGRLQELTGWDPRDAAVVVGTSAGSITAVTLRSGVSPADRLAHFRGEPLSAEATALYGRISTPYEETTVERDWRPMSPKMTLRAAWPPWRADPIRVVFGQLPRGTRSNDALGARMNELHGPGWPKPPTWIVAVRLDDGRRVVFGRDDVKGDVGQAVRASAAIPGFYTPGRIGRREYLDGGVHSSTNADLMAPLGLDLVVVSSVMTGADGAGSWTDDPRRAWFGTKLADEVATIRAKGVPVLVVEPDEEAVEALQGEGAEGRAPAALAGADRLDRVLDRPDAAGLHELITRAVRTV